MSKTLSPILVFGHDPSLLETRRWVLERASFTVQTTSNLAETERFLQLEPRDLLVLCHSLPIEMCRQAVDAAHRLRPGIRIVVMSAGMETCPVGKDDEVISSFDGPRALLDRVRQIISCPASAAR